ncbi:DUF4402 domain-containing protein [Alkalilimnicola ehrlichii]|nr:DUF4402 domain-containing protein [Alkalilimnicola ehrlichii]
MIDRKRFFRRPSAALALPAALLLVPAISSAEDSATANTAAEIFTALTIEVDDVDDTLDFARIAQDSVGGTVTIAPDGTRTCGVFFCEGTPAVPTFHVEGEPEYAYTITFEEDVTIDHVTDPESMAINDFTHNATETLDTEGEESFEVGATLNVAANQATGTYEGTFDVTVAYE